MKAFELAASTVKASALEAMEFSPTRVASPIHCDAMALSPPKGLLIAGFPWAARPSAGSDLGWEVDEDLVDTIVAWSALGNAAKTPEEKIECVLEVDYRDQVPAQDLVHLASYGEFSLALVGASTDSPAQEQALYAARLKEVALAMLSAPNFAKSLYPFSNEFEAFFLEGLGKPEEATAARDRWSKGLADMKHPSGARVEYALKRTPLGSSQTRQACHEALLEHFGSQEMLEEAMRALARPIAKRLEGFAREVQAQPKSKQDRFDLTAEA
jgi:hypothetical protein